VPTTRSPHTMPLNPLNMAWFRALQRPFWTALFALVVVASVVLSGQFILRAPFSPSPMGVIWVWLGFVPEMIGICAPVALLFAAVTVSRLWTEGGEYRALFTAGLSIRRLLPVVSVTGGVVALGVGLCTHWLAPMGRTQVRAVLSDAMSSAAMRARVPVQLGAVWLRVDAVDEGRLSNVVVAAEDWVGWASTGRLENNTLYLDDGRAENLDARWSLQYESAQIPLDLGRLGIHNFDRSSSLLFARIREREAQGKDSSRARLTLHKRTTLPLSAPLLGLLGIPLGRTLRRPALVTIGVVLLVWAMQRTGDHTAASWGAGLSAVTPLGLLSLAVAITWSRLKGDA
jgi:lipopolysaccharide export LptBFGC system permease protein LptF